MHFEELRKKVRIKEVAVRVGATIPTENFANEKHDVELTADVPGDVDYSQVYELLLHDAKMIIEERKQDTRRDAEYLN